MRPETGVMRFGDDWAGVFIRGDNAYALLEAMKLIRASFVEDRDGIGRFENIYALRLLDGFMQLLGATNEIKNSETEEIQRLHPYKECVPAVK